MKKLFLALITSTLIVAGVLLEPSIASATVNDFYFDSFEADYFLAKSPSGRGDLMIKEKLVAVFPDYDQNHGIERCLPQTSFSGTASLDESSIAVSLNDEPVPYTIEDNYSKTCIRIGDAEKYIHGNNTYKIDYIYKNVIIDPYDSDNQELYWNTNGTGWAQKFNSLTATVHIPNELASSIQDTEPSCYVGAYGVSGPSARERCEITSSNSKQTIVFKVTKIDEESADDSSPSLNAYETLTFDIEFEPNTFTVAETSSRTEEYTSTLTGTNKFYFESATFDYYLSKNPNNSSHMEVKEVLTAIFPNTNQNHGIERCIPNKFRSVKTLNKSSFSVTRNGAKENFSTNTEDDVTCYRIGNADSYVHGTQTYEINYYFDNVILQPYNSDNQELYWDTNGTSWPQKFLSLTATVHLSDDIAESFLGQTSCYVGSYGTSGSNRCITKTSESGKEITFSTQNLSGYENLSLDLEFAPDTFYITPDLTPIITGVIAASTAIGIAARSIHTHKKAKERNADKISAANSPKPVQYIPRHDLSVAQAKEVWMNSTSTDTKVASLMELAVHHKIELEKTEKESKFFKIKSNTWKIHVKNLNNVPEEQVIVLQILNGGSSVHDGDIIKVENQSYSSRVASLATKYNNVIENELKTKGLFEHDDRKKHYILASKYNKYEDRTIKGIEASNYYDGLEEYIKLAEKDRIKFLHSVKGADVSHAGIVKLYEKLLPYAIIFNCEDSWLEELNKYYQLPDVEEPDWLATGLILSSSDFSSFRSSTMSSVSSATISSDSGGSSGGGGGGFSGGGGGGGGGGGW
ncbi:DUF2207 domain-containing protein [Candidatus Saccharibacteria bacterium]|nr:DUF2207 domain-containing protein [Candidatus Saccharibacteria bacterium]